MSKKNPNEIIDLRAGDEFTISPAIKGNLIRYHGSDINLKKVSRAVAETIANDPNHRYLTFTNKADTADAANTSKDASAPKHGTKA